MKCAIYKGIKKSDSYLYVLEKDEFSDVPQQLLDMLGKLEFVMEVDLSTRQTLAQAGPKIVTESLQQQGYFFQIPPKTYLGVTH